MARLLLVDDDRTTLHTLGAWLRCEHEVKLALGFAEAIMALADGPIPDVVIADSEMGPYRGDDLLAFLSARYPEVGRVLCRESAVGPPIPAAERIVTKGCEPRLLSAVVRSLMAVRRP